MCSLENQIEEFKQYWNDRYSYVSLELSDDEIVEYIVKYEEVFIAADRAYDYHLANGLGDVVE